MTKGLGQLLCQVNLLRSHKQIVNPLCLSQHHGMLGLKGTMAGQPLSNSFPAYPHTHPVSCQPWQGSNTSHAGQHVRIAHFHAEAVNKSPLLFAASMLQDPTRTSRDACKPNAGPVPSSQHPQAHQSCSPRSHPLLPKAAPDRLGGRLGGVSGHHSPQLTQVPRNAPPSAAASGMEERHGNTCGASPVDLDPQLPVRNA